ncbi:glycosyltransferase [Aestuariibaculum sp. M13]|uniref:glycosyltransferase n=1 Tax=Aestuariibaculum sp. M13 TaxID=2967132 RepID=UPI002159EC1C|nr:glycosyltransferase [Aestuariibaculum sp. M13]MCR8666362.1 glycosyltransferase [Aestuariibaculum sp. M13]
MLNKFFLKSLPKGYLSANLSKELKLFFKTLFTGYPVFYLYADKDAFLLPLLKRYFKLKRLKIYGTLHWSVQESGDYSFYKHGLITEFNGIIALSKGLCIKGSNSMVIPHGINLDFWKSSNIEKRNLYLLIGVSNRNHKGQADIVKSILQIDSEAVFILLSKDKKEFKHYVNINQISICKDWITDVKLRELYDQAKAVILIQNYCFASNVVLESMAMGVPLIANRVGDIEEYLGGTYPLYIEIEDKCHSDKIKQLCHDKDFYYQIQSYLQSRKYLFEWNRITEQTEKFILKK